MAAKDPVADKSSFLCMYMSNHPDTLVAYVKYFGKVKEQVASAEMNAIDSNGMTLLYKVKGNSDKKSVRINFDPPLAGYEEVKPRLLAMTADAQESLGMSKAPQITTFQLTQHAFYAVPPILLLAYSTVAPHFIGTQWVIGQALYRTFGGAAVFPWIWVFLVSIHALEAVYVQRLAVRHKMGLGVGTKYVLATIMGGGGVIIPLRKRIQKARIDSIMKGN